MNEYVLEAVGTLGTSLLIGALSIPIAKSLFEKWVANRNRWKYPDMEELRKLINDNETIVGDLQKLLIKRYNMEAFHIATGIQLKTAEEMPMLFDKEREFEGKFGWQMLRRLYPVYLHPSHGSLEVRITKMQYVEHYMLRIMSAVGILLCGYLLFSIAGNARAFVISFAMSVPLETVN